MLHRRRGHAGRHVVGGAVDDVEEVVGLGRRDLLLAELEAEDLLRRRRTGRDLRRAERSQASATAGAAPAASAPAARASAMISRFISPPARSAKRATLHGRRVTRTKSCSAA
jgi:hypothetical protein